MTSPVISDSHDDDEGNKLVLGSMQATIKRVPGSIVMTLSHHPPSWMRDGSTISGLLRSRARLQLWGHRHEHETSFENGNLHLSAGAVHPERGTFRYEPRYNIIHISIGDDPKFATVKIDSRVWYGQERKFGPDFTIGGERYEEFTLETEPPEDDLVVDPGKAVESAAEASAQQDSRRTLAYLFSSLPYQRRLRIAVDLGLIDDPASAIKDQRLFELVLARAVEANLLSDLWAAIQGERGSAAEAGPNPFIERSAP
jgi:hypothetical protein